MKVKPHYDSPQRFEKTYFRLDWIPEDKDLKILLIGDSQKVESDYLKSKGYKNVTSSEYEFPLPDQIVFDIETASLPEKFDLIFCSHVLEHLKDPKQAFLNIKKMVKKGGQAYIFVPEYEICQIYDYHISCLRLDDWLKIFGDVKHKQFLNLDQEEYFFHYENRRTS